MKHLPATVEELAGARAARWIRESTPGQFDRYGPEAQTEFQDRAITRLGLVDSGLAWRAAHSGRTVYRWLRWQTCSARPSAASSMSCSSATSRAGSATCARTLELLEDTLHPAGVPVYFCDEEILSSSERQLGPARRRGQGRRALQPPPVASDPGGVCQQAGEGRATRAAARRSASGATQASSSSPTRARGDRRVFELAAAGLPDRAVAAGVGLPLFTVRGILTSPLYAGRLRDGEPARWPPLVPLALWEAAQATRARRATRRGVLLIPAGRTPSTCSTARRAAGA